VVERLATPPTLRAATGIVVPLSSPGQSARQTHLTSMAEQLDTPPAYRAGTGTVMYLSYPGQSTQRVYLTSVAEWTTMRATLLMAVKYHFLHCQLQHKINEKWSSTLE
jgi:hypothetical protein